jgi:cyclophilin family peptidyl-prolyl cis-trans isomerase
MIQGGGFLPDMSEKDVGPSIVNESRNKLHNVRGTIAMARTNDPDSATAQFFINQRTNLQLDWAPKKPGYTVFGEVTNGIDIVDFIASSPVITVGPYSDVPSDTILIIDIKRKSLL